MTEDKQKLLAVDGVEQRIKEYTKVDISYIIRMDQGRRDRLRQVYEQAVWIDSQLSGSCTVDPFFGFHFYKEEDAVAFKLKWS